MIVKAWIVRKKRRLFEARAEIRLEDADRTLLAEVDATMYRIASADTTWRQQEQKDVLA